MTAHAIRAILLAMATEATRAGFLASNATKRGSTVLGFCLAYRTSAVAPTTRSCRRYRSPILVMRPKRSLPPLELCRGVSPSQAANCRPDENWLGLVTDAASAVAPIGPMPGIVARRRARSSFLCRAARRRSSLPLRCPGPDHHPRGHRSHRRSVAVQLGRCQRRPSGVRTEQHRKRRLIAQMKAPLPRSHGGFLPLTVPLRCVVKRAVAVCGCSAVLRQSSDKKHQD